MDAERRELLQRRNAIREDDRMQCSLAICSVIALDPCFDRAESIMFYMPAGSEVNLEPLMLAARRRGKQVLLPRCDKSTHVITPCIFDGRLSKGAFGMLEPAGEAAVPQIIICPMLAFNRSRYRMGYGAGCYDRLLAGSSALFFGAAFAAQEHDFTPKAHDVPLHRIFTQEEII